MRCLSALPAHRQRPALVVFPQDLLEKGLEADNFAMLGLGDIVIPGKAEEGSAVNAAAQSTEPLRAAGSS
ncbi:Minor histocompatibility antigen H13 [Varanus komodoensis]|nr:Minor histocompatibility antigen H13 [Varanus komodoensis]